MTNDTLSRDDMKPVNAFDSLPKGIKAVLKRAAAKGASYGPDDIREIVGRDWIMVPTKKGLCQVAVKAGLAYRL
jgi:hypothetical protein